MDYLVDDLVEEAKVAIDENVSSAALADLGDVDTLKLDEILLSKVEDAAFFIEGNADALLLDSGRAFGDAIDWESSRGYGAGSIHLPDDFLRLVSFEMSDWSRAVTVPITEDDPLYDLQRSRYGGVRGNPERPVVAITRQPIGLVLEFYSCTGGPSVTLKRARYIPVPTVRDGHIVLSEKLRRAVVYYMAYLASLSMNADIAQNMLITALQLAGIRTNTNEND